GGIERKQPRLDLGDRETRHRAGKLLAERDPLALALRWGHLQHRDAVGEVERGAETVGKPRFQPFAHDDAVDDDVDILPELLVERWRLFKIVELAVDLDPLKALLAPFE